MVCQGQHPGKLLQEEAELPALPWDRQSRATSPLLSKDCGAASKDEPQPCQGRRGFGCLLNSDHTRARWRPLELGAVLLPGSFRNQGEVAKCRGQQHVCPAQHGKTTLMHWATSPKLIFISNLINQSAAVPSDNDVVRDVVRDVVGYEVSSPTETGGSMLCVRSSAPTREP